MSGRLMQRILASVGILSAAVMIFAARAGQPSVVTAGAAAFAFVAVVVAILVCRQAFRWVPMAKSPFVPSAVALLQSSSIAAVCYAWGAVAMQGLYLTPLTGLKWQHGWQYALAMALLAVASIAFARSASGLLQSARLTGAEPQFRWAVPLAAAQAGVAGVGLIALAASGKLSSTRADWAANRVFTGLAVAILAVSIASIVAHRRLSSAPNAA
ncbi:MAG: hypothetical protein AB7E81_15895 [Hyphomicrobiaceae bacterium]